MSCFVFKKDIRFQASNGCDKLNAMTYKREWENGHVISKELWNNQVLCTTIKNVWKRATAATHSNAMIHKREWENGHVISKGLWNNMSYVLKRVFSVMYRLNEMDHLSVMYHSSDMHHLNDYIFQWDVPPQWYVTPKWNLPLQWYVPRE